MGSKSLQSEWLPLTKSANEAVMLHHNQQEAANNEQPIVIRQQRRRKKVHPKMMVREPVK